MRDRDRAMRIPRRQMELGLGEVDSR
jgi:hypothetical protein